MQWRPSSIIGLTLIYLCMFKTSGRCRNALTFRAASLPLVPCCRDGNQWKKLSRKAIWLTWFLLTEIMRKSSWNHLLQSSPGFSSRSQKTETLAFRLVSDSMYKGHLGSRADSYFIFFVGPDLELGVYYTLFKAGQGVSDSNRLFVCQNENENEPKPKDKIFCLCWIKPVTNKPSLSTIIH